MVWRVAARALRALAAACIFVGTVVVAESDWLNLNPPAFPGEIQPVAPFSEMRVRALEDIFVINASPNDYFLPTLERGVSYVGRYPDRLTPFSCLRPQEHSFGWRRSIIATDSGLISIWRPMSPVDRDYHIFRRCGPAIAPARFDAEAGNFGRSTTPRANAPFRVKVFEKNKSSLSRDQRAFGNSYRFPNENGLPSGHASQNDSKDSDKNGGNCGDRPIVSLQQFDHLPPEKCEPLDHRSAWFAWLWFATMVSAPICGWLIVRSTPSSIR
jgi:hypothetical protein